MTNKTFFGLPVTPADVQFLRELKIQVRQEDYRAFLRALKPLVSEETYRTFQVWEDNDDGDRDD
jgi:hypothetical protein